MQAFISNMCRLAFSVCINCIKLLKLYSSTALDRRRHIRLNKLPEGVCLVLQLPPSGHSVSLYSASLAVSCVYLCRETKHPFLTLGSRPPSLALTKTHSVTLQDYLLFGKSSHTSGPLRVSAVSAATCCVSKETGVDSNADAIKRGLL